MTFESELAKQSEKLTDRIRADERALLPSSTAGGALLYATARSFKGAVLVTVPDDLDRTAYLILAAARQCGTGSVGRVADSLQACPADPSAALGLLGEALGDRKLFVDRLDRLRLGVGFDLPRVFAKQDQITRGWLERRLAAGTDRVTGVADRPVRALLESVPAIGNDPVREHLLTQLSQKVLGEPVDDEELEQRLRQSAPAEVRRLVDFLAVHGRPLQPELLVTAGLVSEEHVSAAVAYGLVRREWGFLRLHSALGAMEGLPDRLLHQLRAELADGLAVVADAADPLLSPVATLEAHRHYSELGDVPRARQFARFGVQLLLQIGRRASVDQQWKPAIRAYDTVLQLDEQARTAGDQSAVAPEARAYAIHYRAYNRYKSQPATPPTETLADYREALTLWPINGLFWSRTIVCCFVADRYPEAHRAVDDAFAAVPDFGPGRADVLVRRTTDRLLDRGLVVPAWLVWRSREAHGSAEQATLARLTRRSAEGLQVRHLWGPGGVDLVFRDDLALEVSHVGSTVRVRAGDEVADGEQADACLGELAHALFQASRTWLETPEPSTSLALADIARMLDVQQLAKAHGSEDVRWVGYLARLWEMAAQGEVSRHQRAALLRCWRSLRQKVPSLRYPLTGRQDDGRVYWTWKFREPAGLTFSLEVDQEGGVEWFYRDAGQGLPQGSHAPTTELPNEAIALAAPFAR